MHDGLAVIEPAVATGPAEDGGGGTAAGTPDTGPAPDLLPPQLLQAAISGDPAAVALLLSRIQPQVERFCRARLGRRETTLGSADDVAQDVCMAVLAVLPDYRLSGMSFRAFVFGIARHKIADAFRAMARNRCDAVEELPERIGREEDPEQVVLDAERNDRLTDLLGILGKRQVEILTLRIAVGLTAEETADALGSTPGAVRVAQHRALQRLRRELEDRAARRGAAPAPASAPTVASPPAPRPRPARPAAAAPVPVVPVPARPAAAVPAVIPVPRRPETEQSGDSVGLPVAV
ncbi:MULTISPECIES: RNA polymerase sigma factor ShbA [Pseudonocardia]|uniref:ECF RNA polymerase sigma factor SigD n=2 Tax=Pseudonocardia TaxID=1847 RepID=A0A1Y2N2K8_PSEAH|nr:RNA polymerase sigma factor ShbA [Pseudonocardia saturnea]OSY41713.1 ECF RNA polymerase sigma factor SigD [Pseudonocardia autotrophica]TDN71235.1 RNA polymerase sigma factor (sigma-70 family) [Pseudonocardia autotrophica]BBG01906.1 hypothetical protein Pdca_31150 [Pseudonocardia autotrophica]GEC23071.1 hypothetical protein PSA01_01000 [Pseudonocardia saturnea]